MVECCQDWSEGESQKFVSVVIEKSLMVLIIMSLKKQLRPSDNSPSQDIQFRDLHLQH